MFKKVNECSVNGHRENHLFINMSTKELVESNKVTPETPVEFFALHHVGVSGKRYLNFNCPPNMIKSIGFINLNNGVVSTVPNQLFQNAEGNLTACFVGEFKSKEFESKNLITVTYNPDNSALTILISANLYERGLEPKFDFEPPEDLSPKVFDLNVVNPFRVSQYFKEVKIYDSGDVIKCGWETGQYTPRNTEMISTMAAGLLLALSKDFYENFHLDQHSASIALQNACLVEGPDGRLWKTVETGTGLVSFAEFELCEEWQQSSRQKDAWVRTFNDGHSIVISEPDYAKSRIRLTVCGKSWKSEYEASVPATTAYDVKTWHVMYAQCFKNLMKRRDIANGNKNEIETVYAILNQNPEKGLTVEDSVAAGNCRVGTLDFCLTHGINPIQDISFKELYEHKDISTMIRNYRFRNVVLNKVQYSQTDLPIDTERIVSELEQAEREETERWNASLDTSVPA